MQNVQELQEASTKIVNDVQQFRTDITEGLQQTQQVEASIIEQSNDDKLLEKLTVIADYIEQKDESQQIVESIEAKISAMKPDNSEIKNLLDFIASQVVNANENSVKMETLSRKVDLIETKLSSLEQYMARLIEYLDEDE